jgi:2-polyprenyl-3-methyl-5-hydroxy-6-metoxy-1,4-benzoquinol methylase
MANPVSFTDEDARAAWNQGAEAWEVFVETGADYWRHEVHGPALLVACEPVAGLDVLDLGCGQGFFTRHLARRGARVTGIDLSEGQLAFARGHETQEPLGIRYELLSASEIGRRWPEPSFDRVTACMSLHDMADPGGVLAAAFGVLRAGGRLAFSIMHPFTDTPVREWEPGVDNRHGALKIDRYFDTGPAVCHWSMRRLVYHWDTPYWRRTLSEWSALIAQAGFLVRGLHEPRPTEEQARRVPKIEDARRLPSFLIFDLVKMGDGDGR